MVDKSYWLHSVDVHLSSLSAIHVVVILNIDVDYSSEILIFISWKEWKIFLEISKKEWYINGDWVPFHTQISHF